MFCHRQGYPVKKTSFSSRTCEGHNRRKANGIAPIHRRSMPRFLTLHNASRSRQKLWFGRLSSKLSCAIFSSFFAYLFRSGQPVFSSRFLFTAAAFRLKGSGVAKEGVGRLRVGAVLGRKEKRRSRTDTAVRATEV